MLLRGGLPLSLSIEGGVAVSLDGALLLFAHQVPFNDCFTQEGVNCVYNTFGSYPSCMGQPAGDLFITWLQVVRGSCELIRDIIAIAVRFGTGTLLDVFISGVPFGPDDLDIAGAFLHEEVGSGRPYISVLSHSPWPSAENHG